MKILAVDLGKFTSVACCLDIETNGTQYHTLAAETGRVRASDFTSVRHTDALNRVRVKPRG